MTSARRNFSKINIHPQKLALTERGKKPKQKANPKQKKPKPQNIGPKNMKLETRSFSPRVWMGRGCWAGWPPRGWEMGGILFRLGGRRSGRAAKLAVIVSVREGKACLDPPVPPAATCEEGVRREEERGANNEMRARIMRQNYREKNMRNI